MAQRQAIRIKYHTDIPKIERFSNGNWLDLRAAEDVVICKGEYKQIPLGVSMELPPGYEALVAPRSSTFKRYGIILANGIGIIDNSFNGNSDVWNFLAYCLEPRDSMVQNGKYIEFSRIQKGDRICQFRIIKSQPEIEFYEVENLGNKDRGGIGSTGVR